MSLFQEVSRIRVIGHSEAIRRVQREALLAARGDANILITGEPGVGKAVIARFVHESSGRSQHGFAMINFEGLPDVLLESELFGHVQGSFSGAYRDKPGLLSSVPGGTIFLEGVGALSVKMQARLLRFLETGAYLPVGMDRVKSQPQSPIQVRPGVRLIASTTADLRARVADGTFLRGLYDRLSDVGLTVPPLRERRDDIPSLVDHFVGQFVGRCRPFQINGPAISPEITSAVREVLSRTEWPGNVRELKDVVLRQVMNVVSGNRTEVTARS